MSPHMPHPKAFSGQPPRRLHAAASFSAQPLANESSRAGAIAVAAFSALVLAAATSLAGAGTSGHRTSTEPMSSRVRRLFGIASSIDVVSDSRVVVVAAAGARTTVTGRVLDADGSPVPGSAVRIRSEARPGWDWVTSSGTDGSFQVDGVAAGKMRVTAQDVEAGTVESPPIDASGARDVVLVLDRTVSVIGVVHDDRGVPIARAAVKWSGKSGTASRVVIADEEGRFAVRGGARSVERITVWARGFEATTFDPASGTSASVERDVRLHAARPLHGVVVDAFGDVVAGARVSACPGKEAEVATSDAEGAFQLPATAIGCWATASHPRFSGSRALRIGDRSEMVLRLATGGAIEGTVVDERGKSIALFAVSIASFEAEEETPPGTPTRSGETAEHLRGAFRLDDLPAGTYVLQVSAEGMVDTQSRPIQVGRGKVIRGEQIVLTAAEVVGEAGSAEEAPNQGIDTAQSADGDSTAQAGSGETTTESP